MRKTIFITCFIACLLSWIATAQHIQETMYLNAGWNAVYLESTPQSSVIDDFFAEYSSVTKVCEYVPDAAADTVQYNPDGSERNQKAVEYRLWLRNGSSTISYLEGGKVYLVYATEGCTIPFHGIPASPDFLWHPATTSDGVINLVGVSAQVNGSFLASTYFKEGPYGANGAMYTIGGTDDVPKFLPSFSTASAKVCSGRAYGVTSTAFRRWPGAIAYTGGTLGYSGVRFDSDSNIGSLKVINYGTTNRQVRITYVASSMTHELILPMKRRVDIDPVNGSYWTNVEENVSWEVPLAVGESKELVFGIERSALDTNRTYGAVLVIDDLGGSQMRVRAPVTVEFPGAADPMVNAAFPAGLWLGKFQFDEVTFGTNASPVTAGGTLRPTAIFHVDSGKRVTMYQRISVVQDTNGVTRLFKNLDSARAVSESARRISTLMIDPANQAVVGTGDFDSNEIAFEYTVSTNSAGNPFYHAWHPDHDGLNSTYDGKSAEGGELWNIRNRVTLQFRDRENGQPLYASEIDEVRAGRVIWQVDGLRSGPIACRGIFSIQRVLGNAVVEE